MSPMIKKKTSELEGAQLDWAVAKLIGCTVRPNINGGVDTTQAEAIELGIRYSHLFHGAFGHGSVLFRPSTEWSQAGPIIERERIWLAAPIGERHEWDASVADSTDGSRASTPLIAAMRAFVASRLGDEVEVPA